MREREKDFIQKNKKDFPYFIKIRELQKAYKQQELIFIKNQEEICGFYIYNSMSQLKSMFIAKEFRGRKLGEYILNNLPRGSTIALTKRKSAIRTIVEKIKAQPLYTVKGKKANLIVYKI